MSAFALPDALTANGFAVRVERADDGAFLERLYASTRQDELAVTQWSAGQKAAFLAQQFQAQRTHYRGACPDAAFLVIERDARPVGRLYLDRRGDAQHIIDISLLPEQRGQGLGTALVEAVIAQAAAAGLGGAMFVARSNPALRLYRRLGFVAVGETGAYLEMRRALR